jgi:hypothetical protein
MSVRQVTMYRVVCDWPGCEASAQDDSEYYAWTDGDDAEQYAADLDWRVSLSGLCHYCPTHPAVVMSEHEYGEPFPEPPYLLIHDGDVGNPEDDGRATYIEDAS